MDKETAEKLAALSKRIDQIEVEIKLQLAEQRLAALEAAAKLVVAAAFDTADSTGDVIIPGRLIDELNEVLAASSYAQAFELAITRGCLAKLEAAAKIVIAHKELTPALGRLGYAIGDMEQVLHAGSSPERGIEEGEE